MNMKNHANWGSATIQCQANVLLPYYIDNKTLEGQSTIETIDFNEVKSKNGVEYFVGEIPAKEARSN